mmetsp:Transcript_20521/g.41025  ORF Transcript_20521/g.41025 Transcript_20521/m.41025 type:complete len:89 (+) Transcript_20521:1739-2005(+)
MSMANQSVDVHRRGCQREERASKGSRRDEISRRRKKELYRGMQSRKRMAIQMSAAGDALSPPDRNNFLSPSPHFYVTVEGKGRASGDV